jgi:hypothetical protein
LGDTGGLDVLEKLGVDITRCESETHQSRLCDSMQLKQTKTSMMISPSG